jgi:lipoate-protein ligase A
MSGVLHVYRDSALDGASNMARDEHLLEARGDVPAVLRLYAWSPPAISLGYFQAYAALSALPAELRALDVVRRTTGGGAILHDREITYCLIVDQALPVAGRAPAELYRLVHECWRDALAAAGVATALAPEHLPLPTPRSGPFFCFEKPGRTDLLLGEAKLLGSAQRRVPGRVLQHGSLLLERRFVAHPGAALGSSAADITRRLQDAFVEHIGVRLGLRPLAVSWSAAQLADAALRRTERYANDEWTRKR